MTGTPKGSTESGFMEKPGFSSYGVYISQLIRFARVCSNVDDFNNQNLF